MLGKNFTNTLHPSPSTIIMHLKKTDLSVAPPLELEDDSFHLYIDVTVYRRSRDHSSVGQG